MLSGTRTVHGTDDGIVVHADDGIQSSIRTMETLRNSMKPFGNILGNTLNIRGDNYPPIFKNSMKPFGNILGNTTNIRGDDYPQTPRISLHYSMKF